MGESSCLNTNRQARLRSSGMSDGELAEAKRYGRLELGCALADKAVDLVYLAIAAFLLARPLDAWLSPLLAGNRSLRLAALLLVIMAIHTVVSFPLSFYAGHVLEHRFQLSTQTFARWLWRYAKRNLLAVAFSLVLVLGVYWLIWTTGGWWWLAAAAAFFVVSIVLGQLAPVLILPLFYRIEKLEVPELTDRIARLAAGTGLSIEGVYRMNLSAETVKANAMLAGLGRTRRVLLGDTLLTGFTPDEIEVIFAHEIGHHVFRHIRKMILAGLVYSAAGFWVCDRLLMPCVPHRSDVHSVPRYRVAAAAADSGALRPVVGAAAKRRQPAFRAAMRSLCAGADRPERRLSLGVPQAGPAEQGRPESALARRVSVPQPPADCRAAGDGGESGRQRSELLNFGRPPVAFDAAGNLLV